MLPERGTSAPRDARAGRPEVSAAAPSGDGSCANVPVRSLPSQATLHLSSLSLPTGLLAGRSEPMATFAQLGPIGRIVEQAYREDAAERLKSFDSSSGNFIDKYFVSPSALSDALQGDILGIVNDQDITRELGDPIKSRIIADYPRNRFESAESLCSLLSLPHRVDLQRAILIYIMDHQSMRFCLKKPQVRSLAGQPVASVPTPSSPCHGRDRELHGIVGLLAEEPKGPPDAIPWYTTSPNVKIAVCGPGGIGKTTLALHVLGAPAVKARYSHRRFWVACEFCRNAHDFLREVVTTLSKQHTLTDIPVRDADSSLSQYLDCLSEFDEPGIVGFDNLETIFDAEPDLVQCTLQAVLARAAIIVTMRGRRRPSIGGVWEWPPGGSETLEQLPQEAWQPAFEAHAGRQLAAAEVGPVWEVLRRVEGYPLALHLLGQSVAWGNFQISDLQRAWKLQIRRSATESDNRLTCLNASIQVSLTSPLMTRAQFAKDLLFLTANLPRHFGPTGLDHDFREDAAQGLPKWLARAICGPHDADMASWSVLLQSGLAYTSSEAPDCLQLLPAIREVLRSSPMASNVSRSCFLTIELAMETASTNLAHWKFRNQWRGKIPKVDDDSETARGKSAQDDVMDPESTAKNASCLRALGLLYRHAGLVGVSTSQGSSSVILEHLERSVNHFQESCRLFKIVRRDEDALVAEAWSLNVSFLCKAPMAGDPERIKRIIATEAEKWQLSHRPDLACVAQARLMCLKRKNAQSEGNVDVASSFAQREAALWERAGRKADALGAEAEFTEACADVQLGRVSESSLSIASTWEEVERLWSSIDPSRAAAAKTRSLAARILWNYRKGFGEEAASLIEKHAPVSALRGQSSPQVAEARALAARIRAEACEREGDLETAARHRDEEAFIYETATGDAGEAYSALTILGSRRQPELDGSHKLTAHRRFSRMLEGRHRAAESRAHAACLRAELAQKEGRLSDAARQKEEEARQWIAASKNTRYLRRGKELASRARGAAASLKSERAERHLRFEDAIRFRLDAAACWDSDAPSTLSDVEVTAEPDSSSDFSSDASSVASLRAGSSASSEAVSDDLSVRVGLDWSIRPEVAEHLAHVSRLRSDIEKRMGRFDEAAWHKDQEARMWTDACDYERALDARIAASALRAQAERSFSWRPKRLPLFEGLYRSGTRPEVKNSKEALRAGVLISALVAVILALLYTRA